ncbi:MAG: putative glycoside hydrolase [Rectinemataceae bacterium]|jgi:hypothetical protein
MKLRILAAALSAAVFVLPTPALPAPSQRPGDAPSSSVPQVFLAGYDAGLYRIEGGGERALPLWLDGEVRKIIKSSEGWYFLTSLGVLYSSDLGVFEDRSSGLPVKTYKRFDGGRKSFTTETQDLKDLEIDASDPQTLATCTKDASFVSRDGGKSWKSYGSPVDTTGLKAVSLAPYPGSGESALWASHPIKGLFVRKLVSGGWASANAGLAMILGTTSVEEIADIAPGRGGAVWASDSFIPRVYKMDAKAKAFATVWAESSDFGCAESLDPLPDGSLRFVADGYVARLDPGSGKAENDERAAMVARTAARAKPDWQCLCVSWTEEGRQSSLSELWLLTFKDRKPYRAQAENRRALYLTTGFVVHPASRAKYDSIMDARRLDSVVVDMKDDYGHLRFEPRDPLLRKVGKVSSPLDVEAFVREWKAKGRYLIARIPVFKDGVVYKYDGGRYAVRDSGSGEPWQGYNLVKKGAAPALFAPKGGAVSEEGPPPPQPFQTADPQDERALIQEYWVDPYCEEVWAYNVAIANEMVSRGFDEVQFDYIRFPTDGANIGQASFRWKDAGMDKESALASFLRFARDNIAAPISIDIYGANGWYRSGVRTGQDVELMAKYVDVICPMLYPSHFEQGFLAQTPATDRPYRIYKIGALRNAYIARKKVVVRPYVQAFFLNVSYDRAYYGPEYVKREVAGIRDSINLGLTFWNNSGRYDDIPVLDVGPDGRLASGKEIIAPSRSILD